MLRTRANGETFVSATMCPQQCVRNNVSLFARALNECRQITRVQFSTRIFQTLRHPRKQRIRAAAAFWVCFDNCNVLLEQSRNIIMGNQK